MASVTLEMKPGDLKQVTTYFINRAQGADRVRLYFALTNCSIPEDVVSLLGGERLSGYRHFQTVRWTFDTDDEAVLFLMKFA